ncbi:iron ABC transporter permease [Elioraea sp.]|uniref:ABC transporter permease n=1 Tax=Elioraea sp. TaxID=2185103 RepID=UPI0025C59E63|nr:iron ABC transporter permease [Elioraea sp.]
MSLRRRLPGIALALGVTLPLVLFIAWPIATVLVRGFVIDGAMPQWRLRALTEQALAVLPEERRAENMARWSVLRGDRERAEAIAAAFRLAGLAPPWDVTAAFDAQLAAADAALASLAAESREAVEAVRPIAAVMLHRRVALAFQVRDLVPPEMFDALRTGTETRIGLDHYRAPLDDPYLRRAALNSLSFALFACVATTLLAFALAFAVNRGGVSSPGIVRAITLTPLVAPPVLVATAVVMLFGRRGLVTDALLERQLGLIDADVTNIYGFAGILLAQVLSFVPAAFIVLDNTLRRQDGRLDEAAAILGASRLRAFREVTLPLAWPGLKRALVLVFILSLTDFGNPLLLAGRDVPVIAAVIYDEMTAFRNTGLAAALAVWLLAPGLLLHLALERLGRGRRFDTVPGAASEAALPRSWRVALSAVAAGVCVTILLVYATIALGAVTRIWGVDWNFTLGHFTTEGVAVGHGGTGYGSSDRGVGLVWQSLAVALIAAPLGGLAGVLLAFVLERVRPPGGEALAFTALLPAVLPGLIFGIGYILAFNLPFGIEALSLTGTSSILVLNILFGNMFVGVLAGRAALQRADPAIEEAAEGLGAGIVRRFLSVTLPLLRPALLLGMLYVFVDGMTTLSSVIFLVSGTHKLASVAIFNHATGSDFGGAAAKSVVILALAGIAMTGIWWLDRRDRIRLGGIR